MSSKKKELYDAVFSNLKSMLISLKLDLKPDLIYSDFEKGLVLSLRQNFTESTLKCCYFHLLQAWWRKAQKKGLKQKHLKPFCRHIIENLKIAVHIKDKLLRKKFLNEMQRIIFLENKMNLEKGSLILLQNFFKYTMSNYFEENYFFSEYIIHR